MKKTCQTEDKINPHEIFFIIHTKTVADFLSVPYTKNNSQNKSVEKIFENDVCKNENLKKFN